MMTKIEVERMVDERLAKMKKQMMEELQGQINDNPKTIWDLSIGDRAKYYYLYSNGDVAKLYFDSCYDEKSREAGSAFLTREEAEFEAERRKIEAIMRKYSRPFKYREYNYYIKYNHDDDTLRIGSCEVISSGEPYFESREIARKAINEIGEDRLKKYWFRVEDDE